MGQPLTRNDYMYKIQEDELTVCNELGATPLHVACKHENYDLAL